MNGDAIPGFELFDKISEGPVYVSYKARQIALDRWVVLTVMSPDFSADEVRSQRFLKEAKKVARLKHPGILQVFDLGLEGGRIFLVTEYVEGVSVAQLLKSIGKLPAAKAQAIVRAVAGALEFAWVRASLIHGALTPERIVVEQNQTKLAGLGLAGLDALQRSEGRDGAYLPPERGEGDRPNVRDDVYALGLIWRELLTGLPTVPEEARGTSPTAGNPPPGVPSSAWKMVRRMTTPDIEQRYAKWTDVMRDFKAEAGGGTALESDQDLNRSKESLPERDLPAAVKPEPPRMVSAKQRVVSSSMDVTPNSAVAAQRARVSAESGGAVSTSRWEGVVWGVVLVIWIGAGWLLWRLPAGRELDFTVRDLPSPGVLIRPEAPPGPKLSGSEAPVAPANSASPATPAVNGPKQPTPEELRQQTERAIREMEDQVAAYLLREELENSVGALDIILEDSDNDELRRAARQFKEFVAQVAELNTAVASAMRLKSGEEVTVMLKGKPVKGRLMAINGGQIELDETVDQKTATLRRHHSIALSDVDPADRARWLGDGAGPVRKAMLFILAWRSRQPAELLNRMAGQSGALSGAFQRRVAAMPAVRSETE